MTLEVNVRLLKSEEYSLLLPLFSEKSPVHIFLTQGKEPSMSGQVVMVGIFITNQLVGAVVALFQNWHHWILIKDMVLRSDLRNIGIEQGIFDFIEKIANKNLEIEKIVFIHDNFYPLSLDWQNLLNLVLFEKPIPMAWIGICHLDDKYRYLFEQPVNFPSQFVVKMIAEMSKNEVDKLVVEAKQKSWVNPQILPFSHYENLSKEGSLALFKDNEFCGWITCHFGPKGYLEFTNVVVDPVFEQYCLAAQLIHRSVQEMMKMDYWTQLQFGRFFVVYSLASKSWVHSLKRHFKDLLVEDYERLVYCRKLKREKKNDD